MAITITIDNDPVAAGSQPLIEDESLGVQTPAGTATPPSTDTGNEVDVTLTNPVGGTLGGFQTTFNNFLNNVGSTLSTTFGLTLGDTQRVFAAANDGASSASNFVTVTASAGETVSDLFFSDSAGAALDGDQVFISAGVPLQTTSGDNIYLWSSGDFAIATTSSTAGAGRIVAAFYLNDTDPNHLQAQVQMVTFEALKHPNTGSFDDAVNFTNLLQVSAAGSTSFNFDALKSSGGIWAAVGNNQSAIVVSGYSLDVDSAGKIQNTSDKIAVSQGGTGTTIGINNQLFDNVGERAVFTLVSGLDSLTSASGGILSDYIVDHTGPTAEGLNYTGYINVVGAGIFVSQTQGNLPKDFNIDLYHAGGAGNVPEVGFGYIGTEPSGAFQDDSGVNVATVTIKADDGHVVGTWVLGADPDGAGPLQANGATVTYTSPNGTAHVQVTISGYDIDINGVLGGYTASWTSANGATFNRFTLTDSGSGQFDVGRVDLIQGLASHTPVGGNLVVQDDGPTITAAPSTQTVTHDETPGVQADTDVAGSAFVTGGSGATVSSLFTNVPSQGDDLDVAGTGAIGFARSGGSLVNVTGGSAGTDGPAAQELTYALHVTDGTFSGVSTTEGTQIFLYNGTGSAAGLVLGRVGTEGGATDTANASGTVAFALAANSLTGEVFISQYLSLNHPTGGTSYDESISLVTTSVQMSVTRTDGDGDSATDSDNNIGNLISFQDDGPAIVAAPSAATVVHDETPGVQADTDVAGTAFVTGGSGATVASLFTNVPSQGDDLDVTGTGAIGFARSTSSLLTISTNNAGADGPAAQPLNYALSVTDGTFSGVSTTEGTQIFLYNGTGSAAGLILGRVGTEAGATDNANSSGTVAFALATNPLTGEVFVAQYLSLNHPTGGSSYDESISLISGAVQMSVTLTDKDGDTATDSDNNIGNLISFQDDGPSITASQATALSITDDESLLGTDNTNDYSGNFSPVYGADGQGATPVTYALSTAGGDSGLVESSTGLHIFLFKVGNNIVGKSGTDATAAASGTTDFVVSVSSSGVVTLDQQHAVVHSPDTGVDQSTGLVGSNLIHLDATVHDGDTDTAAAYLDLTSLLLFKDDAPTITSQILDGEVAFTQNASVSHSLNGAIGNDGTSSTQTSLSGTAEYAISYWDTPTNVYPNLNAVLSANGTVLTYYSDAADTNAVYRLTLDPLANSGHGGYTFSVLQPPPITTTHFGFADLHSGQNLFGIIAVNKANIANGVLPDGGLLVMPNNPVLAADGTMTNTSGSICTSKGGGGVTIGNTNQAFDHPGEGAFFMYVDNPVTAATSGVGLTPTGANDADTIRFSGVNQATDASVEIVQASGKGTIKSPGPGIHIATYEVTPGTIDTNAKAESLVNDPTAGGAQVNIIGLKIHDATGKVIEYRTNLDNGTSNDGALHDVNGDGLTNSSDDSLVAISFHLDSNGGTPLDPTDDIYSVNVDNLALNYTVEFITETQHDLALVENRSGSYDLGGFDVTNNVNVPQQNFHFATTITDYDNDAYGGHLTQYADWSVTLDGVSF